MDHLIKVIFFYLLALPAFLTSYAALAETSDFTQQLNEISQQNDKLKAVADLSRLLNSTDYQGSDKVKILMKQGKLYFMLHQYHKGIEVANSALSIAENESDDLLSAEANKLLGILYYYLGELKISLNYYQESLAYYEDHQELSSNKFAIERANLFNNIALAYASLGQTSLALKNYQLAEPLYSKYGDEEDKIDVRYNIAVLHINLRRFDNAIDILKMVIIKRQQLKNYYGVATAKADLGVAYRYSGQLELAKNNLFSSLEYFQEHDHKFDVASQLHNISEVYLDLFVIDKSIKFAKQALEISDSVGHQRAYAGSLHTLSKASLYLGNLTQAQNYIERSNAIADKLGFQSLLIENLAISALINAGENQYPQALSELGLYEKKYQTHANTTLNDKLAEFESEQLNQQIIDLENRRKLQELESAKTEQQRNVIILVLVLILMSAFYIYRRHLEKRLTKELELRVKQRTRELEELTHKLEKADQVKSQFLANMSHEIRTPLTAIVGHSEAIIHDDIDQDKVKQDVAVIHSNSLHLLELINDILDLSRLEAKKFELESQPLNIKELIQDLSHTFKAQADKKNLNFTIVDHFPLPYLVHVDYLRLKQILFNLCSNAIKFTEKGSVTLTISIQHQQLHFSVKDTGIGLSKQHLSQVFNLFTQADNSISRRFGGSGLGLALSKQLATLMSGKITVESELGKGSEFRLTLPCDTKHTVDMPAVEFFPEETNKQPLSGTILLAEDHDDNRHLIARLLSSLGLTVLEAKNGKEAVHLCVQYQPALILLDIQMPEMDGVEAYKTIREKGCTQPIYALTANAMSHEVSQYLALGFTGHLKKPIERKAFIATVARYFSTDSDTELAEVENYEEVLSQVDLTDLIEEFRVSLSQDKQAIISYSQANDLTSLAKLAHKLAGAAQMFGFIEINQVAKELEQAIKSEMKASNINYSFIHDLADCLIDEISVEESVK